MNTAMLSLQRKLMQENLRELQSNNIINETYKTEFSLNSVRTASC